MGPREHDETSSPAHGGGQRALWSGLDQAYLMSTELIAAILTWTGIGWLLDRWLGTMPWFLAGGALVGNAAGLYLIWWRSGRQEDGNGRQHPTARATSAAERRPTQRQGDDTSGTQ